MPNKTLLMLPVQCVTADDLRPALERQQAHNLLTRNQVIAIMTVTRAHTPAAVSLYQRMPKGATYVHINGALAYTVSQSAHVRAHNGEEAPRIPIVPRRNYAFSTLLPGMSLTIERMDAEELRNARGAAYRAAQYYNWRITTRKTKKGLTVQRIS